VVSRTYPELMQFLKRAPINMQTQIVKIARQWLNTPFKHQGRVKHVGCDCLGLVAGVLKELNLKLNGNEIAAIDNTNYSALPDGVLLQQALEQYLERSEQGRIEAGNILLMRFHRQPQHLAIVTPYENGLGIIHSYAQAGKVVEHRLDELWQSRIVAAYKVPTE
jgi:NlpC/P60 family putative phage cell wall peptidase